MALPEPCYAATAADHSREDLVDLLHSTGQPMALARSSLPLSGLDKHMISLVLEGHANKSYLEELDQAVVGTLNYCLTAAGEGAVRHMADSAAACQTAETEEHQMHTDHIAARFEAADLRSNPD